MSTFDDKTANIVSMKVIELINNANVSVRLRNSINRAAKERTLPFETLADFFAAGDNAEALLLKIPNLGQKTAKEFINLVNDLANHDHLEVVPESVVSTTKNRSLSRSNEFLSLFKEGFSYKDIAELHHISEATVRKYLNEHPNFDPSLSPIVLDRQNKKHEKSNQFLDLYKQGLTYQDIGNKYGISRERVRQILVTNPAFEKYLEEYDAAKFAEQRAEEQERERKLTEGSIGYLYPEQVAELWDYDKNGEYPPGKVQAGSTLIYVWLKCPIDGFSWQKRPCDITTSWDRGKRGCPVCAGKTKKPEKQPSLMAMYPEFVSCYWDHSKNDALGLNPATISLSSNRKAWLKCPEDGHEWEARIHATVNQQWSKGNAGCRVCNGTINRKLGQWKHRASLSIEFPDEIAKYWDYEKNNEVKIYPGEVTGGSAKKVWFKCPVDGFEWFSAIAPTVRNWKKGRSGCSRCGKGWTFEAVRQFVASLEKHIPNLTQAERYKIFEQAGVLNATGSESLNLVKAIIKGKLTGQKLNEFIQGKGSKASEYNQDVSTDISGNQEVGFLDADSKLETSNIVDSRVEHTEQSNSPDELPTVKVKNSLEFLSSQIVASAD